MHTAFQTVWVYLGFLYFGVGGTLYSFVSSLLYPLLPRAAAARVGRSGISLLVRSLLAFLKIAGLIKLDLSALDQLKGERGIIIAPNHPSLLDALFVISRVPQVSCIMKAKLWDNPIMGGGSRLAGYIRNDSPLNMVRQASDEVISGHPLLIFPEGTRTLRQPINEFKGGFALIAKKSHATIQTVFIETNSPFLSKGWPLLKRPQLPLIYRARLGKRFTIEGEVKAFVDQLQAYYREELSVDRPVAATSIPARQESPHPDVAA
ncbi:MAG: lysophospholipid acyltransferase family protein [Betaproteobacteria bacterium]